MTWNCWTRKRRRGSNGVQYMMDSLFTIAIIFWLGFQTLSCAARQDPILQVCNWTSLTQKDIQSENGVEQDKKSAWKLKLITRCVPTISLRNTLHYLPCNKYKFQSELAEISRLESTKINLRFNSITHAMRTTYQAQANQFAKGVSSPSLQPCARDFR